MSIKNHEVQKEHIKENVPELKGNYLPDLKRFDLELDLARST